MSVALVVIVLSGAVVVVAGVTELLDAMKFTPEDAKRDIEARRVTPRAPISSGLTWIGLATVCTLTVVILRGASGNFKDTSTLALMTGFAGECAAHLIRRHRTGVAASRALLPVGAVVVAASIAIGLAA